MTKTMMGMMAVGAMLVTGAANVSAQDRPAERQKNQQKRIVKNVKEGDLTKKEARNLEEKERALHREIKQDRKDGGGLTPKERAKIEAEQDALSRAIHKQATDKQKKK